MLNAIRTFATKSVSRRARYTLATGAVLLMTVILGACGVSSTSTTGLGSSGAATPTATSGVHSTGTSVKPCPIVGTNVNLGSPALVLTPTSANHAGTAHVGDLIVVELPATSRWQLSPVASASLQPDELQGVQDDSLHACIWSFRAQSAGTASLNFSGSAVCEGGQECPQFVIPLSFTVKVD